MRKKEREIIRKINKKIRKMGEEEFLLLIYKEFRILSSIVEDESPFFYGYEDSFKNIVQRKLLNVLIPYFLNHHIGRLQGFYIGDRIEVDGSSASSYELNYEWNFMFEDNPNLTLFELFGFRVFYAYGDDENDFLTHLLNIPGYVRKLVDAALKHYLEYSNPEYPVVFLLYHPAYNHFIKWCEEHSRELPGIFTQNLTIVKMRLNNMYWNAEGVWVDTDKKGAVFPLIYDLDGESNPSRYYYEDSLYAAFILLCLIIIAQKRGYRVK